MRLQINEQFWVCLHRYRALLYAAGVISLLGTMTPSHPMYDYAPWATAAALAAFGTFLALSAMHIGIALFRVWAAHPLRPRQQASLNQLQIR
jgi:hypothetical protein